VTQEEYGDTMKLFRCEVRKATAQVQLELILDLKGNKRGFYRQVTSKMKTVYTFWILLNGEQHPVIKAMEKPKILDGFFF